MTAETTSDWRRTSPTAAVIFFGRAVRAIVVHGAPALVPLAATFAAVGSQARLVVVERPKDSTSHGRTEFEY